MHGERRGSPRVEAAALPDDYIARLRAGAEAEVLNVSPTGVLLESTTRLLPGRRVTLRIGPAADLRLLDGEVVRCALTHVAPSGHAIYRAAIRFLVKSQ